LTAPRDLVIIAEKPNLAATITRMLGGKWNRRRNLGHARYGRHRFAITSVAGHVVEWWPKNDPGFEHPEYVPDLKDFDLVPIGNRRRFLRNVERVVDRYARGRADAVVVATDNDPEGELIGWETLLWLKKRGKIDDPEKARRMRFSAYTRRDIIKALKEALKGERIDPSLAYSALARRVADWMYGIPLTRKLSPSRKNVVSVGRVQTPTLKLIVDREKERREAAKKRRTYYVVVAETPEGTLVSERFEDRKKAENVASRLRSLEVTEVERKEREVPPPPPFNLVDLQRDAGRFLRMSPKRTLTVAQRLYERGLITYPRTGTNRYPPSFDHDSLMNALRKAHPKAFRDHSRAGRRRKPVSGREDDGAHPPITPTGRRPPRLKGQEWRLYDMIVRRYLATWTVDARVADWRVEAEGCGVTFEASGKEVLREGWYSVYGWRRPKEKRSMNVEEGDVLPVVDARVERRKKPLPKRYTKSSLVAEMKRLGLGTEATRADVVEKLISRGYVKPSKSGLVPTKKGEKLVELMENKAPELASVELTRRIEKIMDEIAEKPPDEAKRELEKVAKKTKETVKKTSGRISRFKLSG